MKYLNLLFRKKKKKIRKTLFFNEITLEYKETKLSKDYTEREKRQTCVSESLKEHL